MQSSTRVPSKPKGLNWPVSSHITTFVRNLRLLHLDQRPDWPDITLRSFVGSQPNLRQRIKAVEWSLYYLFVIWDPDGTQNKLRPFFPPLEPLQSVNLRAALFRALSDLKKNGVLGREAILRKTMLDECKGEKFEEILATFSTAILRKSVSGRTGEYQNPVLKMGINGGGVNTLDQEKLVPLILAHRASLSTMVNDKGQLREAYSDLKKLLQEKTEELASRSKDAAHPPSQDEDALSHDIMNLWYGNDKWAETIVEGGVQLSTDRVLELPFSETWSLLKNGQLQALGSRTSSDLLADLDSRLAEQKARVEKWREFKKSLGEERRAAQPQKPRNSSQSLIFREHQSLSIATLAKSDQKTGSQLLNDTEYSSLISALDAALLKHEVSISGKKQQRDEGLGKQSFPSMNTSPAASIGHGTPTLLADERTSEYSYTDNASAISPLPTHTSSRSSPRLGSGEEPGIYSTPYHLSPPASGIATPSITIEDDPEPQTTNETTEPPSPIPENPSRAFSGTLLERTRQSMSFLPAPSRTRPRHSIAARPRHSQSFPVNQFGTPKKQADEDGRSGATTPRDELFSQEADYASVFKSRPRVATSPVNSPSVHMLPMEDGGSDVEMDGSLADSGLHSSPLFGARFTSRT
ncbi:hypothetical protein FQN52_002189 [Onygenales sp. PD_12]|nr:hypothetical protein FQN52_002189 [Onygenales sp. PD_12]